jgi:5-hydroxyisourate hydrolase-like protein (transthyretin family)
MNARLKKLMKSPAGGFLKSMLVLTAVIWTFIIVFSRILNLSPSSTTQFVNPTFEPIYNLSILMFLPLATFSAILGALFLSANKSLVEIIFLFIGHILPRQRKYWGVVKDAKNKAPIPFATIRVIEHTADGDVIIAQTVSDQEGKYRIHIGLEKGKYSLIAKASGYLDFNSDVKRFSDPLAPSEVIGDIFMSKTLGSPAAGTGNMPRAFIYKYAILHIYLFSILLFAISIYGALAHTSIGTIINFLIFAYSIVWNTKVIRERALFKSGRVLDQQTGMPIESAQVSLFTDSRQIESTVSNQQGLPKFGILPGEYKITVSKKGYKLENSDEDGFVKVNVNSLGYLDQDVLLREVGNELERKESLTTLPNPFG